VTASPWYKLAFQAPYLELYRHRTGRQAQREAAFALAVLQVAPGSRILDLCCGNGRHARALAAPGHRVAGLDLSRDLLRAARGDGGPVHYVCGDMRNLPFRACFDAVTLFFTSFGYFATEEENLAVLREISTALHPGGRSLVDFLNADQVRRSLVPESVEERDGWSFHLRRRISGDGKRVEKHVQVRDPAGRTREYTESVRLYDREDLEDLSRRAQLPVEACYGDFDGSPAGPDAPRLIVVGRKA
jgi:SAM-dependent methyltransferase